jgi:hypothetical protein
MKLYEFDVKPCTVNLGDREIIKAFSVKLRLFAFRGRQPETVLRLEKYTERRLLRASLLTPQTLYIHKEPVSLQHRAQSLKRKEKKGMTGTLAVGRAFKTLLIFLKQNP